MADSPFNEQLQGFHDSVDLGPDSAGIKPIVPYHLKLLVRQVFQDIPYELQYRYLFLLDLFIPILILEYHIGSIIGYYPLIGDNRMPYVSSYVTYGTPFITSYPILSVNDESILPPGKAPINYLI